MIDRVLRAAYGLRYHQLLDWPLDRWLVFLLGAAAAVLLVRSHLLPASPSFLTALVLILGVLVLLGARGWAVRRSFISFVPDELAFPPAGQALDPAAKIPIHATGPFAVEGKEHFFADLPAYWRTFATREHAVLAIVLPTRCGLVGHTPESDLGMWYIFFQPEAVQTIAPGRLAFGTGQWLALRVLRLLPAEAAGTGKAGRAARKARRQPKPTIIYLGFDDENARQQVWADLLADGR